MISALCKRITFNFLFLVACCNATDLAFSSHEVSFIDGWWWRQAIVLSADESICVEAEKRRVLEMCGIFGVLPSASDFSAMVAEPARCVRYKELYFHIVENLLFRRISHHETRFVIGVFDALESWWLTGDIRLHRFHPLGLLMCAPESEVSSADKRSLLRRLQHCGSPLLLNHILHARDGYGKTFYETVAECNDSCRQQSSLLSLYVFIRQSFNELYLGFLCGADRVTCAMLSQELAFPRQLYLFLWDAADHELKDSFGWIKQWRTDKPADGIDIHLSNVFHLVVESALFSVFDKVALLQRWLPIAPELLYGNEDAVGHCGTTPMVFLRGLVETAEETRAFMTMASCRPEVRRHKSI